MSERLEEELARIDALNERMFSPQEKKVMKELMRRRLDKIVKLEKKKEEEPDNKTIQEEIDEIKAKVRAIKRKVQRHVS